jgi:hypothetical protein
MDKVRQQYNRLNRQPTQEVVLTMWHLGSKPRPHNLEPGPGVPV